MSEDFAKKMSIQDWPPKKQVKQDKITEIKLVGTMMNHVKIYEQYSPLYFVHIALRSQIYRFPKARNIMDLALIGVSIIITTGIWKSFTRLQGSFNKCMKNVGFWWI